MSRDNNITEEKVAFLTGLQTWVDEAPAAEKASREEAQKKIIEVKNNEGNYLKLSQLNLSSLPQQVWSLTTLKILDLSFNPITTISAEIKNLTNLQLLFLACNSQLKTLPKEIENLTALQKLWLIRSQIETLPEEIGNLTALIEANLSYNRLTTIPDSLLTNIPNSLVRKIDLSNNLIPQMKQKDYVI